MGFYAFVARVFRDIVMAACAGGALRVASPVGKTPRWPRPPDPWDFPPVSSSPLNVFEFAESNVFRVHSGVGGLAFSS